MWTGSGPAKMLIPFNRYLIVLQPCHWKFLDNETLQQTFNDFFVKIHAKKISNLGIWTPCLASYWWRMTLVDCSLESPWSTFYSCELNIFHHLLQFRSYGAKYVQLGCFCKEVDHTFALKFYLDRVNPINHSWHQKTRDTGLPNGEDHIPVRSLVLTQY